MLEMILRDVRMAGFKYYYGYNEENEAKSLDERIPRNDYLEFIAGDTAAKTEKNSHAPEKFIEKHFGDQVKAGTVETLMLLDLRCSS